MNNRIALSNKAYILLIIGSSIAWLTFLYPLMIADVWDETNGLLTLSSEPFASAGFLTSITAFWLHQVPVDIYRPLGFTFFVGMANVSDFSFIAMRYFNAMLLIGSSVLLCSAILRRSDNDYLRAVAFHFIFLFSASSLITAGWFANMFDATALLFISVSLLLFDRKHFIASGIALGAAAFCKEIHILAFVFFALMYWRSQDKKQWQGYGITLSVGGIITIAFAAARLHFIPLGSDSDLHGFSLDAMTSSFLSYFAGFLFQFSKFESGSVVFFVGLAGLISLIGLGMQRWSSRLFAMVILLISAVAYWGMLGYQSDVLMSSHNFVGRLYLIPFCLILFLVCLESRPTTIGLLAAMSFWGMSLTYIDHFKFQQVYRDIYAMAEAQDETLYIHYPEKPLSDPVRKIEIGNFAGTNIEEAIYVIDVRTGEISPLEILAAH